MAATDTDVEAEGSSDSGGSDDGGRDGDIMAALSSCGDTREGNSGCDGMYEGPGREGGCDGLYEGPGREGLAKSGEWKGEEVQKLKILSKLSSAVDNDGMLVALNLAGSVDSAVQLQIASFVFRE